MELIQLQQRILTLAYSKSVVLFQSHVMPKWLSRGINDRSTHPCPRKGNEGSGKEEMGPKGFACVVTAELLPQAHYGV